MKLLLLLLAVLQTPLSLGYQGETDDIGLQNVTESASTTSNQTTIDFGNQSQPLGARKAVRFIAYGFDFWGWKEESEHLEPHGTMAALRDFIDHRIAPYPPTFQPSAGELNEYMVDSLLMGVLWITPVSRWSMADTQNALELLRSKVREEGLENNAFRINIAGIRQTRNAITFEIGRTQAIPLQYSVQPRGLGPARFVGNEYPRSLRLPALGCQAVLAQARRWAQTQPAQQSLPSGTEKWFTVGTVTLTISIHSNPRGAGKIYYGQVLALINQAEVTLRQKGFESGWPSVIGNIGTSDLSTPFMSAGQISLLTSVPNPNPRPVSNEISLNGTAAASALPSMPPVS